MIEVKPDLVVDGVWRLGPSNNQARQVFAFDQDRKVHRLGREGLSGVLGSLEGAPDKLSPWQVSFHPKEPRYAVVTDDGLVSADLESGWRWIHKGEFSSGTVLHARAGDRLWAAERIDADTINASLIDEASGHTVASLRLDDRLGDTGLRLTDTPGEHVVLELTGGQDGVEVWQISYDGMAVQAREVFPDASFVTPAWHPHGHRLLALENDDNLIAEFSYPDLAQLAKQSPDAIDYDDEASLPGYALIYLADGVAITQGADYRFHLFDPAAMARIDEIVMAGWEPLPTPEVYPTLTDETGPISVVIEWDRVGPWLVATTMPKWRKPALLVFDEVKLAQYLTTFRSSQIAGV
jgi:hypothetical protein